jgi:hypothetical protein
MDIFDDEALLVRLLFGLVAVALIAGTLFALALRVFGASLAWQVVAGITPVLWLAVHMLVASIRT